MVERPADQMGGESNDQIVINSSIALLQERFRKLERVKEMRELSMRSTSSSQYSETRCSPPPPIFLHHYQYEPSKLFFESEILIPPRPSPRVPLSLWPGSQIKRGDFRGVETLELMSSTSWPTDKPLVLEDPQTMMIKFNDSDSDVDTSLHL